LTSERSDHDDRPGVHKPEQDREGEVGERAADHQVHVVQPVAEDRGADRHRPQRQRDRRQHRQERAGAPQHRRRDQSQHEETAGEREPFHLLSQHARGGPEPSQGRHQRSQHGNSNEGNPDAEWRRQAVNGVGVRFERPWSAEHHSEHAQPRHERPAPAREVAGREQQQDQYEQRCLWEPARPRDQLGNGSARPAFDGGAQPPALCQVPGQCIGYTEAGKQPPDRVTRVAGQDQCPGAGQGAREDGEEQGVVRRLQAPRQRYRGKLGHHRDREQEAG